MSVSEIITFFIVVFALITSTVSAYEAYRSNKNAIRPVLVVVEKLTDNRVPKKGYSIFLVNMGHSLSMNVEVSSNLDKLLNANDQESAVRDEIAVSRRGILASGYKSSII